MDALVFRGALTGDVEHLDLVAVDPLGQRVRRLVRAQVGQVQVEPGFAQSFRYPPGQGGAAGEPAMGADDRAVRIPDVLFGALGVAAGVHLLERVAERQRPGLGSSPLGHPAAVGEAVFDGGIDGGNVGAGLAAGDDFLEHGSPPSGCGGVVATGDGISRCSRIPGSARIPCRPRRRRRAARTPAPRLSRAGWTGSGCPGSAR